MPMARSEMEKGALAEETQADLVPEAVLGAGADGFALAEPELRSLVERIAGGRSRRVDGAGGLTGREVEVLRMIAAGLGTDDIAAGLGISRSTVQSHVKNVLAKLRVHSKMEAVLVAWREGLAPVPV